MSVILLPTPLLLLMPFIHKRLHSEDFMAVITEITADMYHFEEAERVESAYASFYQ